jgi:uncharacterized protein YacL
VVSCACGITMAVGAVVIEYLLRASPAKEIAGGAVGALLGLAAGLPVALILQGWTAAPGFFPVLAAVIPAYLGMSIGASVGGRLLLPTPIEPARSRSALLRILDTSVIIDGRIADVADTGFLEGTLVIPRFVLAELQQVADSQDSLKRARGRRGLDVLQRIQTAGRMPVEILDDDFAGIREVDRKLVEMAKARRATLVTNDFNLNKVATLESVAVLNVNELANALRPVVLPGENMRVLVTKEGKEHGQGIAYLDDGTMVVVDNGRRAISKTVEVTVTSVLQTTAGKMIFARFEDRPQTQWQGAGVTSPAAATTAARIGAS